LNETPADSADVRIAQALLARGRLKDVDLARAQRLQGEAGGSIAALLVRLGMVSERDMAEAASEVLALPLVLSKECPEAADGRRIRAGPSRLSPVDSLRLEWEQCLVSRWHRPTAHLIRRLRRRHRGRLRHRRHPLRLAGRSPTRG